MALPGWLVALGLGGAGEEQVQPGGVDLRVAEVHVFRGAGFLGIVDRRVAPSESLEPRGGVWELAPGVYKVVFMDAVYVPEGAAGVCFPRSSLLRSGVLMGCAVWDPGYRGRGEALLAVLNPRGFVLERGARVAQLVYVSLRGFGGAYRGVYQGERLQPRG